MIRLVNNTYLNNGGKENWEDDGIGSIPNRRQHRDNEDDVFKYPNQRKTKRECDTIRQ